MVERKKIGPISFILRFTFGFVWLGFWSLLCMCLMILALPFRTLRVRIGNFCGKIIGPVVSRLVGAKIINPDSKKLNTSAPAIFVTNHTSALDVFVGMALCPYGGCGVGKKEILKIPFFGQAYWLAGHLLIDRSNNAKAIASMAKLSDFVKSKNLSIWIWPEGTRSMDGKLIPFKKGFVHLALETGLPVVPVMLRGAHEVWPAKTMQFYPGNVEVEVLDPIETDKWSKDTVDDHVEHVKSIMTKSLAQRN
ncbi:MAG: lysophospholipid acyltransferase family protein [Candidatus Thermoplasmatota archaeon]|nr:lysophospholipid acyltransferase family protein [Candidatus Thermoplasmatota archaeon]